jgi:hypothetical protein
MQLGSDSSDGQFRQAVPVRNGDSGSDDSFSRQTGVVRIVNNSIPSRRDSRLLVSQSIASWFRQGYAPDSVHKNRTMYEFYCTD